MRKLSFILFISIFVSCNSWLDVTPQDTADEDQLFETGDGYRNVLNGVYKQMSSNSMYGKELSWGTLDVMGQLYHRNAFRSTTTYYKLANTYDYKDAVIKDIIKNIWSLAYNSIANCNSILCKIDETDSTLFRSSNNEKMLIKGEALALRAFLHFDMLRLFAPAPDVQDREKYIPYFRIYPSIFEPDRTVKEVLELVIQDLEEARSLVASHDTIAWRRMLSTQFRINYTSTNPEVNPDLFFRHRGFRMNYLAVSALLARVYNYMGEFDEDYYQKSYDMAEHIINFNLSPEGYYEEKLKFTPYYYADQDKKLYKGVIFCLSNQKLMENYKESVNNDYRYYLQTAKTMFDDEADIRKLDLTKASGSYQISLKNVGPDGDEGEYFYCKDMLPMIRLSELYYLQAETLCRRGDIAGAVDKIDVVRRARGCQTGSLGAMHKKIKDFETFKEEMVKEAARDFMQEGQVFFYYKRFKLRPLAKMTDADMVFPKPDNENIH